MKTKLFFTICLLWALSLIPGKACSPIMTYNYYMYYIIDDNAEEIGKMRTEQLSKEWSTYVGKTVSAADVAELAELTPAAMDTSRNVIITSVRNRNDREMKAYLTLLLDYMANAPGSFNEWDYPSAEEIAARNKEMKRIASRAAAYNDVRLFNQYTLLQMRSLFQAKDYAGVISIWKSKGTRMKDNVFKNMAKGFYAGALYRTDQREDACEIYAELGDIHSATWCMKDERNLGCIKRVYATAPNSRTLQLLVQDFVNNAQETLDAKSEDYNQGRDIINKVYRDEVEGFIAFAQQVVKEGKTSTPSMWYSAAALLNFLYGNFAEARTLADKAMTAQGNAHMKDNARIIRLLVSTAEKHSDENAYESFLISELQWLNDKVKAEDYKLSWNAANRIYRLHLIPRYEKLGRPLTAAMLTYMAETIQYGGYYYNEYSPSPLYISYGSEYITHLWEKTPEQLTDFYKDLFSAPHSGIDLWLFNKLDNRYKKEEVYCDLIGTRYMKEGKFAEALPWLQKVSTEFISAQNISFYMAQRDYNVIRWLNHRQTIPSQREDWMNEEPMKVMSNQKVDFCKDIIALENAVAKHQASYDDYHRLANLYYQISDEGDCWYLTDYAYTTWKPEKDPFVAKAYEALQQASYTTNDELRLKVKMGKAFINTDADYWLYIYNYNNDIEFNVVPEAQQFKDFAAFALEAKNYKRLPDYVSMCDVLKQWWKR